MNLQTIQDHPAFRQLASERARLGVAMSIVMAAAYFAYILTIAFWPRLLGHPLWDDTVITWGVCCAWLAEPCSQLCSPLFRILRWPTG